MAVLATLAPMNWATSNACWLNGTQDRDHRHGKAGDCSSCRRSGAEPSERSISGVAAVYNRFQYLEERKVALEELGRYIERLVGRNVVALPVRQEG